MRGCCLYCTLKCILPCDGWMPSLCFTLSSHSKSIYPYKVRMDGSYVLVFIDHYVFKNVLFCGNVLLKVHNLH